MSHMDGGGDQSDAEKKAALLKKIAEQQKAGFAAQGKRGSVAGEIQERMFGRPRADAGSDPAPEEKTIAAAPAPERASKRVMPLGKGKAMGFSYQDLQKLKLAEKGETVPTPAEQRESQPDPRNGKRRPSI